MMYEIFYTEGSLSGGANLKQASQPMYIIAKDEKEARKKFHDIKVNAVYGRQILKIKEDNGGVKV